MRITRWLATWMIVGALALGIVQTVGAQQTITLPTQSANAGSNFAYRGGGFTPGETISLWITPPDGSMVSLDAQNADGNGQFVSSVIFPGAGMYKVTALGLQSGREVIAGFNVGGASNPSAMVMGGSVIQVSAYSTFTFTSGDFAPGEPVAISETQPNGAVIQFDNAFTDSTGLVTAMIAFDMPGQYTITARGLKFGVVSTQVYFAA